MRPLRALPMNEIINTVTGLVNDQPVTLLVLAMGGAIWWLARRLNKKEKTILHLTAVITGLHADGVEIDEKTQIITGLK